MKNSLKTENTISPEVLDIANNMINTVKVIDAKINEVANNPEIQKFFENLIIVSQVIGLRVAEVIRKPETQEIIKAVEAMLLKAHYEISKSETQDLIKNICDTFSSQYTDSYIRISDK